VVDAVHLDQVREHGGLPGTRDENALESALARPRNLWSFGRSTNLARLGASYLWGIARNHPYRDGNKRTAFLAMAIFVELNGYRIEAPEEEVVQVMLAVADRRCNEPELAEWIRKRLVSAK